jgi:N-acetylmuramoyl-L-alanine amidase
MARLSARGLQIAAAVWLACAASTVAQQPVRVAPTRPSAPVLWPTTRLHNIDCVSVRDLAARFDLKAAWTRSQLAMTLSDAHGVRFAFEASQHDFHFDGLRVFLGETVFLDRDSLWVSLPDVIKLVAPLLRPEEHVLQLPPAPPKIIVLDPGHGGGDPGTENKRVGVTEKTFALDVALRVKKTLESRGWQVLLTRVDDRELSPVKRTDLQMRDDFANKNKADLFLSIHFNSVERDPERVTGVETYTMSPQFMLSTGNEEKDDMTDKLFPSNKLDFANLLFGVQIHRAMLATLKTPDRGFKRGRRSVLRFLECPGALVECGYLSNNTEARRVATPEFRQQIAEAIASGVQAYANTLAVLHAAAAEPEATKPK